MNKYIQNDYRHVELRKLKADVLCDLIHILEIDNDWKKLMSLIPKDINSEQFEPKYNSEHIRLIEEHAKATDLKCTEILFDEWGTSGKVRPTLYTLKDIVLKAQMFRAADEIARLLKEPPPLRPSNGPAAPISINITQLLNKESSGLDSSIRKLGNDTTKEMNSASDMIKFSSSVSESTLPMDNGHNMDSFKEKTPSSYRPDLTALIPEGMSSSINNLPDSRLLSSAEYTSSSRSKNSSNISHLSGDAYQTSFPNIDISQGVDSVILKDINLKHFNYDDLRMISNNFSETLTRVPYLTGKIGSGGFGEVFVGRHSQYGLLAIKKVQNNMPVNTKCDIAMTVFNTEVKFLAQFKHKNIVPIFGYSIDGPAPCIVCEYIDGGSLHYNIGMKTLHKQQRLLIMTGTAEGLKYLHNNDEVADNTEFKDLQKSLKNFVHGDVKSANILLTQDCVPKLCDFGLSKQYDATTFITTPQGTRPYMAHEMLHGTITQKGDVYSFGIVLLELLTGLEPIVIKDGHRYNIKDYVEENLSSNNITELLDPVVGEWLMSKDIYNLSQQCTQYDRKSRPSINEVCDTLHAMKDK